MVAEDQSILAALLSISSILSTRHKLYNACTLINNVFDSGTGQSVAFFGVYKVKGRPVSFQLSVFIYSLFFLKQHFPHFFNFMNSFYFS